jgi:soluble lytic murein transglycosylase-like protein
MQFLIPIVIGVILWRIFLSKKPPIGNDSAIFPDAVEQWNVIIYDASNKYDIPSSLIKAIIWQESSGDPNAFNPDIGTRGLMQMSAIACEDVSANYSEMFDAEKNIFAGTKYISLCYHRTHDWTNALRAYNGGIGNVYRGTVSQEAMAYAEQVIDKATNGNASIV